MSESMIGVVGTILGTVLGWFLNSISNRGKIKIYVSAWDEQFQARGDSGGFTVSKSIGEVAYYSCRFALDIYNSSGEPKIMRNIRIIYNDGKNDLMEHVPNDDGTKVLSSGVIRYNKVIPLTIPSKSVLQIPLCDSILKPSHEIHMMWNTMKIYLSYTDERNREKRILLTSKSIRQSFDEKLKS